MAVQTNDKNLIFTNSATITNTYTLAERVLQLLLTDVR